MPQTVTMLIMFATMILLVIAAGLLSQIVLWIQARHAGAPVGLVRLASMKLQGVKPSPVVRAYIRSHRAGLDVPLNTLKLHVLAGGNVKHLIDGLIAADHADIPLSIETACAFDLAGRNLTDIIHQAAGDEAALAQLRRQLQHLTE